MRQVADISLYQGTVDFAQVKAAGITGVIVKLSEGVNIADPKAMEHCDGARAAGLEVAGYHFARLSAGASANANQAIARANACGVDTVWLDFEDDHNPLGPDDSTAWALAFLDAITQANLKAGFYTFTGYARRFTPDPLLAAYPLWLANYGQNDGTFPPTRPAPRPVPPWDEWQGWQHTSVAQVPGINGNCDLSVFNDAPAPVPVPQPPTVEDEEMVQDVLAMYAFVKQNPDHKGVSFWLGVYKASGAQSCWDQFMAAVASTGQPVP